MTKGKDHSPSDMSNLSCNDTHNHKPQHRKTQAQRREETRALVLDSACRIFGEKGYEATSLDDIAVETGLTIRPIYHYFGNKQQLFAAVTEAMEQILVDALQELTQTTSKVSFAKAWQAFLTCCQTPGFTQIVLLDAPHVLGRARWHDTAVVQTARQILALQQPDQFDIATDDSNSNGYSEGQLSTLDKELLARMLVAAMAEAALMVAQNPDYDGEGVIQHLLTLLQ